MLCTTRIGPCDSSPHRDNRPNPKLEPPRRTLRRHGASLECERGGRCSDAPLTFESAIFEAHRQSDASGSGRCKDNVARCVIANFPSFLFLPQTEHPLSQLAIPTLLLRRGMAHTLRNMSSSRLSSLHFLFTILSCCSRLAVFVLRAWSRLWIRDSWERTRSFAAWSLAWAALQRSLE